MKSEHFRYLLEINRFGSISAAARSLSIGQMRLSSIVKQVEDEIGFPIFRRMPKGVKLTPTGEQFMTLAWEINSKFEVLTSLKETSSGDEPLITLLLSPSIALRMALPLTKSFCRYALPGHLVFEEHPSDVTKQLLLENHANLGLAYLNEHEMRALDEEGNNHSLLEAELLYENEFCVLVSEEHPFAGRAFVTPDDIRTEQLAKPRRLVNDLMLKTLQIESQSTTGFSGMDTMCQAIKDLDMVGIVPSFLDGPETAIALNHLRFVPLHMPGNTNQIYICLFTCKGRRLLHQERILILCIREYFNQIKKDRELSGQLTQRGT